MILLQDAARDVGKAAALASPSVATTAAILGRMSLQEWQVVLGLTYTVLLIVVLLWKHLIHPSYRWWRRRRDDAKHGLPPGAFGVKPDSDGKVPE